MTTMSYKYFCTSKRVRFWMHDIFKFYSRKITKIKNKLVLYELRPKNLHSLYISEIIPKPRVSKIKLVYSYDLFFILVQPIELTRPMWSNWCPG